VHIEEAEQLKRAIQLSLLGELPLQGGRKRSIDTETDNYAIHTPRCRQRHYNVEDGRYEQLSFGQHTQRTATENEDYGPYNALSARYNADETRTLKRTLAKLTEPILIDSDDELPTYNAPSVTYRECHATYDAEGIRAMQQPSAQWTEPIVIDSDGELPTYNAPLATYHEYRATYDTEEVGLE
jgi:hypothetical protein